jgi:non-ribosomal peptide synthetase component E (peptide arylation enzyme)
VNLGKIITRSARYWPDHTAVADSQTRLTYAQLERRSNRLASGLGALGVATGEHVAILAANRVELVEA